MRGWSDEAIKEGIDKVVICVCTSVLECLSALTSVTANICVLSEGSWGQVKLQESNAVENVESFKPISVGAVSYTSPSFIFQGIKRLVWFNHAFSFPCPV